MESVYLAPKLTLKSFASIRCFLVLVLQIYLIEEVECWAPSPRPFFGGGKFSSASTAQDLDIYAVSSFVSNHRQHAASLLALSIALADENLETRSFPEDEARESSDEGQADEKTRQLWLDLRGTAIFPSEALAFLQEFVFDEDESDNANEMIRSIDDIRDLVDRILVSEEVFAKMVDSGTSGGLLYVTKNGDLAESSAKTLQSFIKGRIFSPKIGILDPIAALELDPLCWVVIDNGDDGIEESGGWTDQVEGFIQFLGSTRFRRAHLSVENPAIVSGGLAITCPTQSSLFWADRCLATENLILAGTSQTDSGILFREDVSHSTLDSTQNKEKTDIATALVLPFDLRLWRAAYELRQSNES
mmetsp:Transcript_12013/g.15738  ORF Transcript_12013/g.15738 Transcript_12013/m.15738 type:complete len:360 (+) Transcript_12013:1-1080(+)